MQATIKESNQETQKTIKESNEEIRNKIDALLERDFKNFKPELKYRVQSIGFEQYKPNSIWYHITSVGDDDVFVKNKWTIENQICNKDGQQQFIAYEFSNRTSANLEKSDGEQDYNVKIPDEFFTRIFPDKKSFLLKLELEINPYTDASGPFEGKKYPKKTFIQYDLDQERRGWMAWKNPSGDLNCTMEPNKMGQTFLNTSSVYDFYNERGYEFPEE
ncbi:MAG: hypothetical protein WAO91_08855 [Candidatus Nitrosotenuis sp.]